MEHLDETILGDLFRILPVIQDFQGNGEDQVLMLGDKQRISVYIPAEYAINVVVVVEIFHPEL